MRGVDGHPRVDRVSAPATVMPHPVPVLVHEDAVLRVTALGDARAPGVVLCFTGIGERMDGAAPEEFVASARLPGFSTLFVSDRTRSWYNAFPPEHLSGVVAPIVAGRRVVAIGNSMGGFGAIWASGLVPCETVIAFAPQWSVHPAIVPEEDRWRRHRDAIAAWRIESLAGRFVPGTRYVTINGAVDRPHWSRFPIRPGIDHLLVADAGHNPARLIRERGALGDLIATCVAGGDALACLTRHGIAAEAISG